MARKVSGWTEIIVRAYLEGMGEFDDEETSGLEAWLKEEVSYIFSSFFSKLVPTKPPVASGSSETDYAPSLYEQSLDKLACAAGERAILPPCVPGTKLPGFSSFDATLMFKRSIANPINDGEL